MSRVGRYVVSLIGSLGLAFLPMPPGLARATPERTLYAVFPLADGIILDTHPPAVWAEGPARVVADPGDVGDWFVADRKIIADRRLPETIRRWMGQRFGLLQRGGGRCDATVTGFRLLAIGNPDPALERRYAALRRAPDAGLGGPKEQQVAAELWASGTKFLVASTATTCRNASWAYPASAPIEALAPVEIVAHDSALYAAALDAFRALPQYQALQQRYAAGQDSRGQASRWWDSAESREPVVMKAVLPSATLVEAHASVDRLPHGFEGRLRVLWTLQGDAAHPNLVARAEPAAGPPSAPASFEWVAKLRDDPHLLFTYRSDKGRGVLHESGAGALVEDKAAAFTY